MNRYDAYIVFYLELNHYKYKGSICKHIGQKYINCVCEYVIRHNIVNVIDSSSLSTGVAVAVTFTITFIITLTVSVVITFLITFVIVKRKFEKIYKTTHQPTQQMPLYDTVITPAITKSDVKLEANPAYSTSDRVVMDNNPAYQSCK